LVKSNQLSGEYRPVVLGGVNKALRCVYQQTHYDGRYRNKERNDQTHRLECARLRKTFQQLRLQQEADRRATAKESEHNQRP
jgi:hypothetical protein